MKDMDTVIVEEVTVKNNKFTAMVEKKGEKEYVALVFDTYPLNEGGYWKEVTAGHLGTAKQRARILLNKAINN